MSDQNRRSISKHNEQENDLGDNHDATIHYWMCPNCHGTNPMSVEKCWCGYRWISEQENDLDDKKHLHPNEVWIHWGSTGKELALVATEEPVLGVTCTRFVRAARGDEPEQSALSDEDAQILELVRLADVDGWYDLNLRKLDDGRWYVSARFAGIQPTRGDFTDLSSAVAQLRSRLAPKPPPRPTQERTIAAIRAYLEVADSQDLAEQDELQRVLDDWDKAAGDDATKA